MTPSPSTTPASPTRAQIEDQLRRTGALDRIRKSIETRLSSTATTRSAATRLATRRLIAANPNKDTRPLIASIPAMLQPTETALRHQVAAVANPASSTWLRHMFRAEFERVHQHQLAANHSLHPPLATATTATTAAAAAATPAPPAASAAPGATSTGAPAVLAMYGVPVHANMLPRPVVQAATAVPPLEPKLSMQSFLNTIQKTSAKHARPPSAAHPRQKARTSTRARAPSKRLLQSQAQIPRSHPSTPSELATSSPQHMSAAAAAPALPVAPVAFVTPVAPVAPLASAPPVVHVAPSASTLSKPTAKPSAIRIRSVPAPVSTPTRPAHHMLPALASSATVPMLAPATAGVRAVADPSAPNAVPKTLKSPSGVPKCSDANTIPKECRVNAMLAASPPAIPSTLVAAPPQLIPSAMTLKTEEDTAKLAQQPPQSEKRPGWKTLPSISLPSASLRDRPIMPSQTLVQGRSEDPAKSLKNINNPEKRGGYALPSQPVTLPNSGDVKPTSPPRTPRAAPQHERPTSAPPKADVAQKKEENPSNAVTAMPAVKECDAISEQNAKLQELADNQSQKVKQSGCLTSKPRGEEAVVSSAMVGITKNFTPCADLSTNTRKIEKPATVTIPSKSTDALPSDTRTAAKREVSITENVGDGKAVVQGKEEDILPKDILPKASGDLDLEGYGHKERRVIEDNVLAYSEGRHVKRPRSESQDDMRAQKIAKIDTLLDNQRGETAAATTLAQMAQSGSANSETVGNVTGKAKVTMRGSSSTDVAVKKQRRKAQDGGHSRDLNVTGRSSKDEAGRAIKWDRKGPRSDDKADDPRSHRYSDPEASDEVEVVLKPRNSSRGKKPIGGIGGTTNKRRHDGGAENISALREENVDREARQPSKKRRSMEISTSNEASCSAPSMAAKKKTDNSLEDSDCNQYEGHAPGDFKKQQAMLKALRELMKKAHARLFIEPVDLAGDFGVSYRSVIAAPMDIGTIAKRLAISTATNSYYASVDAVLEDLNLVWDNCQTFNSMYDAVTLASCKCKDDLDLMLRDIGITSMTRKPLRRRTSHVSSRGKSSSSKSLSGRRSKRSGGAASSASGARMEKVNEAENCWEEGVEEENSVGDKKVKDVEGDEVEDTEDVNDGRLVGKDVAIFTALSGRVKAWYSVKVLKYDENARKYTLDWLEEGRITKRATFGVDRKFPIYRV